MHSKAGLVEETKGGVKKERKVATNNEVHHICVETRHSETHWKQTTQARGKRARKCSGGELY
jgi:hypothetical protein